MVRGKGNRFWQPGQHRGNSGSMTETRAKTKQKHNKRNRRAKFYNVIKKKKKKSTNTHGSSIINERLIFAFWKRPMKTCFIFLGLSLSVRWCFGGFGCLMIGRSWFESRCFSATSQTHSSLWLRKSNPAKKQWWGKFDEESFIMETLELKFLSYSTLGEKRGCLF